MSASMARLADAFEQPLANLDAEGNSGLEIEDPDLLPTMDEWQLVYSASVTADGSLTPQMSYDCDNFIMKYFQQPAVFRLSVCAQSAHARGWFSPNPLLCEQQAIPYYTRARKAIIRALGETPTYQTVQVLYQICLFAQWKGQPEIGRPLLKIAQELIIFLRLNIDPSDSPWLFHLNLSERQMEDRRRAFWCIYWKLCFEQATSGDAIRVSIDSTKIRAPAFIFDPHMIFEQNVLLPHICNIYSLISTIKKQNSSAPKSTSSILSQETLLHSLYLATHSSLPFHHLLIADSPFELTKADTTRFESQLSKMTVSERQMALSFNTEVLSTTLLLNRPTLFLTCLKSQHPMFLSSESQALILSAVGQCLDRAYRIAHLLIFYTLPDRPVYIANFYDIFPMFEAMISIWFLHCRMDPVWWSLLKVHNHQQQRQHQQPTNPQDWNLIEGLVNALMELVKSKLGHEGSKPGTSSPILTCMEAIWDEMKQCRFSPEFGDSKSTSVVAVENGGEVEDIVVAMKVASLGDIGGGSSIYDVEEISMTKEPHCFMGLLGMTVGTRLRWKGPIEENWKLFWKLND